MEKSQETQEQVTLPPEVTDAAKCPACGWFCRAELIYEDKCFRCDKRRKGGFASPRPREESGGVLGPMLFIVGALFVLGSVVGALVALCLR